MDGQLVAKGTEVLVEVLIGIFSLAGAYAVYYLHQAAAHIQKKTEQMQDQAQASILWRATQQLDDVATRAVEKFEQTVAATLRQEVKEGKADREALLKLGQDAYDEVIKTVGPEVLAVLQENFGDYVTYIKNTIESKVFQVKQAQVTG